MNSISADAHNAGKGASFCFGMSRQGISMATAKNASTDIFHRMTSRQSQGGFLTLLDDADAEWATREEVARSVWANYKLWIVEK
jgi:hypothetical protein